MIRRLAFLILLCSAAAWAQGSCSLDQGLQCAGNFQEHADYVLAAGGTTCGPITVSGMSGPYAYTFTGFYQDFGQGLGPNPVTYWQQFAAPNSPEYSNAVGTCYLPCNDPLIDMPNCPSPISQESPPFVQWYPDVYNAAGGLLGSTPQLYDGATYCFQRTILKLMEIYTQCGAVRGSLHPLQPMAGPNHCFDSVVTLTAPTCSCGGIPSCTGSGSTSAQWVCPATATVSTSSYYYETECDPGCYCDYYVTDYYDCNGGFVGEDVTFLDEFCSLV